MHFISIYFILCLVNHSRSSWAWVVLLSAFVCTAVVDGLILSFGLHVLAMMEAASWNDNGTGTSLTLYLFPGALLTGMHLYASKFRFTYSFCHFAQLLATTVLFLASTDPKLFTVRWHPWFRHKLYFDSIRGMLIYLFLGLITISLNILSLFPLCRILTTSLLVLAVGFR